MHEPWAFQVADVRVEVTGPREPAAALRERWRALAAPGAAAATTIRYALASGPRGAEAGSVGGWTLRRDGEVLYTAPVEDVVALLEIDVYREVAHATATTPLHAALASHDGRAALLAGRSGAGKSSLALALASRGWTYLGDEHAFVDDALRACGFPRGARVGEVGPVVLPARVDPGSAPLGLVVLLDPARVAGARATPVPATEAAVRLIELMHRRPRPEDLRRLTALASRVPVVRLGVEGVDPAADALRQVWPA